MSVKNLLIIPGSLRANSSTHNIIRFVLQHIHAETKTVFDGTGQLPHFNDEEAPPAVVKEWRALVNNATAILIVTPEYAYGVPGTLKNALDWLVGSGNISGKPAGLITAATGGEYAHASMRNTLRALNAITSEATILHIPFIRSKMNTKGELIDSESAGAIINLVAALKDDVVG
ncbi:MAG: NADPH-dependent oxidoreductase [Chitinophagaceae bacterium]|nr:MAG: NADPH-dependent oxidoreductase [Chitinophagaceae bacterium]